VKNSCWCSSAVLCASVLVKCLVQEFKLNTSCECSSEVIRVSVLVKYIVLVF
jgi:hypothetical protein